tara:strand:- start:589 stop:978 length:390 start_codon:yes stop_codon:yes gene_type:complete
MSKAILEKGKSYWAQFETYGMGNRNMFLHMPNSNLEALEQKASEQDKEDEYYEYVDDRFIHSCAEDLTEGTLDDILLACIGHDMGFVGEPTDYNYVVIGLIDIKEIVIKNDGFDELRMSTKTVWEADYE